MADQQKSSTLGRRLAWNFTREKNEHLGKFWSRVEPYEFYREIFRKDLSRGRVILRTGRETDRGDGAER